MKKNSRFVFSAFLLLLRISFAVAQQPELVVQTGHSADVSTLAFNPEGTLIASGGMDKVVVIWDVKTGKQMRTLIGHGNGISTVLFTPDTKYLISSSGITGWGGETRIWNTDTWIETRKIENGGKIALSPDGSQIAVTGKKGIELWDFQTGKVTQNISGLSEPFVFSPDGKLLAAIFEEVEKSTYDKIKSLCVWDLKNNSSRFTIPGQKYNIISLAFSPDSKLLASGRAIGDGSITLYDVTAKRELKSFKSARSFPINSIKFSRDSKLLISAVGDAVDPVIRIWDIEQGIVVRTLKGHSSVVSSIDLNSDGTLLASASYDKSIRLWRLDTPASISTMTGYVSPVQQIALNSDGRFLATSHGSWGVLGTENESIRLWDLITGQSTKTFSGHERTVTCVAFDPSGKRLASGSLDGLVKIWDIGTAKNTEEFSGHREGNLYGSVFSVAFSPDGKQLASGGGDDCLRLWDLGSSREIKRIKLTKSVNAVAYSPDGNYIVTGGGAGTSAYGSGDTEIKLWDAATVEEIRSLKEPGGRILLHGGNFDVNGLAFSPDSKTVAAACADKAIRLWDVTSGQFLFAGKGYTDPVRSVEFSPDGKYLASSSGSYLGGKGAEIKLWDLQNRQAAMTFTGHSNSITSVKFSRDGKYLISGSLDGSTKVWDLASGRERATLIALGQKEWVVITPDGRFEGSSNGMKLIHYVQGKQLIPLDALFEKYYTPKILNQVLSGEDASSMGPHVDVSKGIRVPPRVQIITPKEGESFTTEVISLTIEATDKGGGIDEIRLFQNGKRISEDQRGMKEVTTVGSKRIKEYRVTLLSGLNEFSATAFSTDRTESTPAVLKLELRSVSSSANLYIMTVGINEYKNSKYRLNYGKPDAQAFLQRIVQKAGGIFGAIRQKEIYDTDAVRVTIEEALKNIMAETRPQDVFVFYYAGHGVMSEGDAEVPAEFYLVPSDVTQLYGNDGMLKTKGISAKLLRDYCARIKAQKQLVVIDACQSGGAIETFAMRGAAEEKAIMQLGRSAGVVVLSSTGTEQFASEFKQLGHGVFTYVLLQGIDGAADGTPMDGKITVKEIEAYLNEMVPELTTKYRGSTQYPNSYSKGQDFPLVVK